MIKNVVEYLENTSILYPNKLAFIGKESSISFRDLRNEAATYGCLISKKLNGSYNKPVCIIGSRSISVIVCLFAVIYSGNYYVMVDESLPLARIESLFSVVDFGLIINCSSRDLDNINGFNVVKYDSFSLEANDCDINSFVANSLQHILAIDPLYGVFTSGSTGVPKLVIKSHRAIISFIESFVSLFDFNSDDIVGNQFPFYFDASTKDLFGCIRCGFTTIIIPKELFSFPKQLVDYLTNNKITKIVWVPSALVLVANADAFNLTKKPEQLKSVFFVGEQMPIKQLNYWKRHLDNTSFINIYGSTEVAGNFLYYEYEQLLSEDQRLPTGKPFPNAKVILLSEDNQIITTKDTLGEICVVSDTLSLGYYGNTELTDTVFVQNPLVKYREIMYKTGDLAVYDENNNIVWVSRKDFQIKHMGYRIELSEIEIVVGSINSIDECCCLYDDTNKVIILFYQAKSDLKKEIGTVIRNKLPKYMYPSKYIHLDKMPHNANGKIDRSFLKKQISI